MVFLMIRLVLSLLLIVVAYVIFMATLHTVFLAVRLTILVAILIGAIHIWRAIRRKLDERNRLRVMTMRSREWQ